MRTEAELKKLAYDIFNNQVFGSWQLTRDDLDLLPQIFVGLNFVNPGEISKDVEYCYEYLNKAQENGINGFPVFLCLNLLTRNELVQITENIKLLEEQKKQYDKDIPK